MKTGELIYFDSLTGMHKARFLRYIPCQYTLRALIEITERKNRFYSRGEKVIVMEHDIFARYRLHYKRGSYGTRFYLSPERLDKENIS